MIHYCIFEDDSYQDLRPITELRPAYDTLVGGSTLFEKCEKLFNHANITLHCRESLKPTVQKAHPELSINNINTGSSCLFFNGRAIITEELYKQFITIENNQNTLFTYKGTVIAAYLKTTALDVMVQFLKTTPSNQAIITQLRSQCVAKELDNVDILTNSWDILRLNTQEIIRDFEINGNPGIIKGHIQPFTVIYNENNVFIDEGANIEDFVVINAEKGPVYIEKNVHINAHSRLEGPLYIGENSHILGGNIRESSIGRHCKISGEVSASVFQGYSNKAHSGYIGNSYIGKWCNLGASTVTSNLKSNYSLISLSQNNKKVETNEQFLGSLIGDHVKTSIGTLLGAGSTIHIGSVLLEHNPQQKEVLPFRWGTEEHALEKFIATAQRVLNRRKISLSDEESALLSHLHKLYTKKA